MGTRPRGRAASQEDNEGNVRRSGKRIRVSAQLVDAASSQVLWGGRYDRELGDDFVVQDELTRNIVRAIRLKLISTRSRGAQVLAAAHVSSHYAALPDNTFIGGGQADLSVNGGVVHFDQVEFTAEETAQILAFAHHHPNGACDGRHACADRLWSNCVSCRVPRSQGPHYFGAGLAFYSVRHAKAALPM